MMKQILGGVLLTALIIGGVLLLIRNMTPVQQFSLALVNSGPDEMTIAIPDHKELIVLLPNQAKTVTLIFNKGEAELLAHAKITMTGQETELDIIGTPLATTILDFAGLACIYYVDYGPRYRADSVQFPPDTPDITPIALFQGKPVHQVADPVELPLGLNLPNEVMTDNPGAIPVYRRLINVPCQLASARGKALYDFLNTH